MAGDWIKMQSNLWTSPKVVRVMSACKTDKCRTIGALYRVWCLFDEHTEDGYLPAYTPFLLDEEVRIEGFAQAMIDIGWLFDNEGEGLQVPDFNDHMSQSAKKRAQDTKRKREVRKQSDACPPEERTKTRPEKRREDNKKNKQKKATPIPENFTISDRVTNWANEKGFKNLTAHLDNFVIQCKSKDYQYADWDSAFMGAIRKDWAGVNATEPSGQKSKLDKFL